MSAVIATSRQSVLIALFCCLAALPARAAQVSVAPSPVATLSFEHTPALIPADLEMGGSVRASPFSTELNAAQGESLIAVAETAPEPASIALLGTALLAIPLLRWLFASRAA